VHGATIIGCEKKPRASEGLGGGAERRVQGWGAKIKRASSANTTGSALFRRSSKEKSRPMRLRVRTSDLSRR
jgi:hypothetical protein